MTCRVLEHVIKIPILSISEIRIFHLFFKNNINIMVKTVRIEFSTLKYGPLPISHL